MPLFAMRARSSWAALRYETEENNGLTTLLSRMLTRGTASLGRRGDLRTSSTTCAGSLSGAGGRNSVGLRGEFLSRHFERALRRSSPTACSTRASPRRSSSASAQLLLQDIATREDKPSGAGVRPFSADAVPDATPTGCRSSARRPRSSGSTPAALRALPRALPRSVADDAGVVGDVKPDRGARSAHETLFGGAGEEPAPLPQRAARAAPEERRATCKPVARQRPGAPGARLPGADAVRPRPAARRWRCCPRCSPAGRAAVHRAARQAVMAYSVTSMAVEGIDPGYFAVYIGHQPGEARCGRWPASAPSCRRSATSRSPTPSSTRAKAAPDRRRTRSACSATARAPRCWRWTASTGWGWTTSSTTTSGSRPSPPRRCCASPGASSSWTGRWWRWSVRDHARAPPLGR